MYIFIDESGNFVVPSKPHAVSCIAALVVPEPFAATLFRKFRKAIRPWKLQAKEVKGSKLDEQQMATVFKLMRRFDVLVVAVCMDMGLHTEASIDIHKNGQADVFQKKATEVMYPEMKHSLEDLAARIRALPNQLYAQSIVLTELVGEVFSASTLYYAQRIPSTLGSFKWRVDAKDRRTTEYEELWMKIVLPLFQAKFLHQPLIQLEGADYSAFAKFSKTASEPPVHLKDHISDRWASSAMPFRYMDIREILTDNLKFHASERYTGLQLVDIVASAIRRACNQTLQSQGWEGVCKLMVNSARRKNERSKNSLRFMLLRKIHLPPGYALPYEDVIRKCDRDCKRMLTHGSLTKPST